MLGEIGRFTKPPSRDFGRSASSEASLYTRDCQTFGVPPAKPVVYLRVNLHLIARLITLVITHPIPPH